MARVLALGCVCAVFLVNSLLAQRPGRAGRLAAPPKRPTTSGVGRPNIPQRTPLDRWMQMSPEQRERALDRLPPERRKAFRERMDRFNRLPKEEQQRLRDRVERFRELSPEKQELMRRELRRFHRLPADRRELLTQEFESLQALPDEERRGRINSEEFRSKYSAEERELLRDLSENLSIFSGIDP